MKRRDNDGNLSYGLFWGFILGVISTVFFYYVFLWKGNHNDWNNPKFMQVDTVEAVVGDTIRIDETMLDCEMEKAPEVRRIQ